MTEPPARPSDREEIRRHLVMKHSWPAVARYEASAEELADLHEAMHDRSKREETVSRIRVMLGMPLEDGTWYEDGEPDR